MAATFVIKVDPQVREELYSDIALEFLDLIFIEGLFVVIQMTKPFEWPISDDPLYYCDDPESQFESSVEYLLSILHDKNKEDGVQLPGEEFVEYCPQYREAICIKLGMIVDSIRDFNDISEVMAIKSVLEQPEFSKRFEHASMHLSDRVMFTIYPDTSFSFPVLPPGAPLIGLEPLFAPL